MNSPRNIVQNALVFLRAGGRSAERGAEMLYRYFYPRFVRRYVLEGQTQAEAMEIANEAMFNVVRGLLGVEAEGALHAWIWVVARNTMLSRVRAVQAAKLHECEIGDGEGGSLLDTLADCDACDPVTKLCLEKQLDRFERDHPKRLICLEMAVIDGLSLPEIAEAVARSYAATKEYLSQCRKQLWAYLKPCFE